MVVLYTTNLKLNTIKLLEDLPINSSIIKLEKKGYPKRGESKRDLIKRRKPASQTISTSGFGNNSINVVLMNDANGELPRKEITVKVFQNGVFHLTGVLDDRYDKCCMDILLREIAAATATISAAGAPATAPVAVPVILGRRVALMNYSTTLRGHSAIPREALHNSITSLHLDKVVSKYDPDVYPGVKVRMGDKWVAKIFRTGKIILSGITSKDECLEFVGELEDLFTRIPVLQTQ